MRKNFVVNYMTSNQFRNFRLDVELQMQLKINMLKTN